MCGCQYELKVDFSLFGWHKKWLQAYITCIKYSLRLICDENSFFTRIHLSIAIKFPLKLTQETEIWHTSEWTGENARINLLWEKMKKNWLKWNKLRIALLPLFEMFWVSCRHFKYLLRLVLEDSVEIKFDFEVNFFESEKRRQDF